MTRRITRREFLGAAVGTLSVTTMSASRNDSPLPRRPLGATGRDVSILGLGCATLGYGGHSIAEGAEIVTAAIDSGINYIDCASSYRNAEEKVGRVMTYRRGEVVLATKTLERTRDAAWAEINRSLERLQTDHVDLLQIHAVNTLRDLESIRGKDGALMAAVRARDEGLCRHIGISGHTRPEVIAAAFDTFPFETALVPISSTDALVNDFGPVIFPLSRDLGFGVIAMKVLAAGRMTDHPGRSIRYSLSHPVSTAIVGMGSVEEVHRNVAAAASFTAMTDSEMKELERRTRHRATPDVLWWKRRS